MWYARSRAATESGKVQVLGIVEEQHPDRAQLFRQWKRLDLPLLADPLNILDVEAVPVTLLIDARGVIRYRNPGEPEWESFLDSDFPEEGAEAEPLPGAEWMVADRAAQAGRYEEALDEYGRRLALAPGEGRLLFRKGVVHRMRYDSGSGLPGDFAAAVRSWEGALRAEPDQYIWRRRIQQYGPRLDKPYPFYDWAGAARREIRERGEKPVPLHVEPTGAEIASPERGPNGAEPEANPDAHSRIARHEGGGVRIEPVAVRSTDPRRSAVRVHLHFRLDPAAGFCWNNEAEPLSVHLKAPDGAVLDASVIRAGQPNDVASSDEERVLECELVWPEGAQARGKLTGYALYNICRKEGGECLYRRQDFAFSLHQARP